MELQPAPVAATEPGKGGFSRLRLEAHGCAPNLPHNFQLITPILPLPSGKKDASALLPRSPVHAKQNDASLPHSETDRRRPMNPLRRPAARREGTPASEIDGPTPAELDPGIGGGGGFSYEPDGTLRPGGGAAAGQGARSGGGGLDLPSCAGFSLPSSCGAPVLLCCCCAPTADSRSSVGCDSERSSPTVADSPTAGSEVRSKVLLCRFLL